jgi:hypothetical protein
MILPPIGNKCQRFCTSFVQSLYYIPDSYFQSKGVPIYDTMRYKGSIIYKYHIYDTTM